MVVLGITSFTHKGIDVQDKRIVKGLSFFCYVKDNLSNPEPPVKNLKVFNLKTKKSPAVPTAKIHQKIILFFQKLFRKFAP